MGIKVAITEDHQLTISGLHNILSFYPHIQVTGTYTTGAALLEGLVHTKPDVLLLDIMLPDQSGKELAAIISKKYPDIRILALTSLDAPSHVESMLRNGCLGYLLKNTDQHTLISAIEHLYRKEKFMDPYLKEQLLDNLLKLKKNGPSIDPEPLLTKREKDVLKLIAEEYTSQEIADKLFISLRTADNHRFNLLQKLDVKNTAGLVKVAIRMGLI